MTDPLSEDQPQSGPELARAFLEALNAWDFDAIERLLARDIDFGTPFSPFRSEHRIEGRDKTVELLRVVEGVLEGLRLYDIRADALASDPNEGMAEFRSEATIRSNGARYANTYIARFSVRDGQITYWAEYYNPLVLQAALNG